jgi:hypothetical protein
VLHTFLKTPPICAVMGGLVVSVKWAVSASLSGIGDEVANLGEGRFAAGRACRDDV